ncbi:ubiquitin carboxyl-terminal hydrolase 16-like [Crassostrea angulata]|uniref:ubiquitin carboxyl-terminal hydrolase 16-like n=1 Tax=Magallana angulata TaxID=2784310 RepID=UPI0022B1A6F7|nr:ubiquitin carboxyl-terminal hydrolase 16-like [Crassostrea angulata]
MDGLHILLLILLGIFILVVAVLVAILILCKKKLKNQGETKNGNENLGNTCFFNSVLQALHYTKSFKEALLCLKPLTRDSDNMALTKNVIALLEKQTIQNEKHRDELKRVLSAVRRINSQFGGGTQEDSYELLNTLVGGISEEMNNNDILFSTDRRLIDVRKMFKGMFIVVYVYDSCTHVEVEFEEFTTLSIPIVDQSEVCTVIPHYEFQTVTVDSTRSGVENGLASLTQIEEYENLPCRICSTGDGLGKSYRKMLVFQPPPVLIIHINRYQMNDSHHLTKNSKQMSYFKRLDVSQFCSVANNTMSKEDLFYELYAVVVHTGEISGGHYYAFVNTTRKHDVQRWERLVRKSTGDIDTLKRQAEIILQEKRNIHEMRQERTEEIPEVKPNWYYVSDQTVTPVSEEDVLSHKDAYILFYEVQ